MGADGCDGMQGAQGDAKTSQTNQKHDLAGIFVTLWQGKFPRTLCFADFAKNVQKLVQVCNVG